MKRREFHIASNNNMLRAMCCELFTETHQNENKRWNASLLREIRC